MSRKIYITTLFSIVLAAGLSAPVHPAGSSAGHPGSRPLETRKNLLLERIEITGNRRLSEDTILGTLSIGPGDRIDTDTIERQRALLLSGQIQIAGVDFYSEPGSERGLVILHIEITEKKKFDFETGYGYHDRYGWFITLAGLKINHPFDTDSYIRLGLRNGFHVSGFETEWRKNTGPESRLGYEARLYLFGEERIFFDRRVEPQTPLPPGSENDPDASLTELQQDIDRGGIEMAVRYDLEHTGFSFGFNAEVIAPDSTLKLKDSDDYEGTEYFPEDIRSGIEENVMTGLFLRIIRDTRDNFIYPTSGNYSYLRIQANNTILGGDRIFSKARFEHVTHIDLGSYRTLAMRLSGGIVSEGAPYHERFSLGGTYSIRGYRERSLSPPGGDDGFWLAGQELRVPLTGGGYGLPRVSGLIFAEAGQGWVNGTSPSTGDIKASAGFGVRLRIPWFGSFGVDAGVPLSESPAGDNFFVHGSLGFSF